MKPETRIQIDFVTWLKKTYPDILFTSTQAGDRRSTLAAIMMKRMGYTPGTPDLIIFYPTYSCHALLLELKTEKGEPNDAQLAFKERAEKEGYLYDFAFGLDEAKRIVNAYMA